jgi:hypothetical protein
MADTVLSWMPLEIIEDVWACCFDPAAALGVDSILDPFLFPISVISVD